MSTLPAEDIPEAVGDLALPPPPPKLAFEWRWYTFKKRPTRIKDFLDGDELAAAQHAWDALDNTPERVAMRYERKREQQRRAMAARKVEDSARRVKARRNDPGQQQRDKDSKQLQRDSHSRALLEGDAQVR